MAAFMAKQMLGGKLKEAKAMGGGDDADKAEGEGEVNEMGEDPEVAEARREAEERRQDKHRKMEEEREGVRQGVRDKYGIKKKVEEVEEAGEDPDMAGRLGRKKKTPAEMAAEAELAEQEEENSFLPPALNEHLSKVTETTSKLAADAQEKCVLQ